MSFREGKLDSPLSGARLLRLMRDNKVKLTDISISAEHVKYFEDWEEDRIVVRWSEKAKPNDQ